MRKVLIPVVLLSSLLTGFGQTKTDTPATQTKGPRELLEAATPFYNFADAATKPWHLKVNYQFYDLQGKPTEQGAWDYWQASSAVTVKKWTRAGAEHTVWSTAKGEMYWKDTGSPLRYFERALQESLLSPLPGLKAFDAGKKSLDLQPYPEEKPILNCLLSTWKDSTGGKSPKPGPDSSDYFCFDMSAPILRMTYGSHITTQFNQIVKTQGHYLAKQLIFTDRKQKLFTASIETIEGFDGNSPLFTPPADATLRVHKGGPIESVVALGSLVKKVAPIYPDVAKMSHVQGTVVLACNIGTDGKTHDLEVLTTPSPYLTQAALDAVKSWEYKPYMLDGTPVEVATVIRVIFDLGH